MADNKLENVWIIITTINKPTLAIKNYSYIAERNGWQLLIVGDKKTPDYEAYDVKCIFLSYELQEKVWPNLSNIIPTNHYCRKNLGYLYALERGADWIFDTDDDNIPNEDFEESLKAKRATRAVDSKGFINVYKYFTDQKVWPRGLPLKFIGTPGRITTRSENIEDSIVQYLADEEPDVDAIYRLTDNRKVYFQKQSDPLFLHKGAWSPFNSQATLIPREFIKAVYLPCFVPFRMTDIWRSFIVQKILWSRGRGLTFRPPNVRQERNPHDYSMDFADEIQGYLRNEEICRILDSISYENMLLSDELNEYYTALCNVGVTTEKELVALRGWNEACEQIS